MKLIRWQPTSAFAQLHDEFDRMMERVLGNDTALAPATPFAGFAPPVDVAVKGDHVEVRAEMPGLEAGDVKLAAEQGMLVISGEKRCEQKAEDKAHGHRYECRYGAFRRVIDLPADVDFDRADATFKNGVLLVKLPKAASAKTKELKIKT